MQKLAEICIRRPVFATMLIMALVVLGFDAYRKLGVDLFPKVDFPIVTITTTLRGAAPEEVETQVSKRIEEAVNTISGIDDLRSISAEGVSTVLVQFMLDKDPEVAAQEVRDNISRILPQLPDDADPPVVEKLATDASPILNVVVSSPRDLRETTKIVDDQIKKNIESLKGVGQVRFVGERQRQIQVWLDGQKLSAYNLNVEQVRQALAAQNVEIPGGRLDQGDREVALRTLGRVTEPAEFGRIVVGNVGGAPVRINDIGRVVDGFEEPRSLARLDGQPAVLLEVRKQAGTNTLEVIEHVKERIRELNKAIPSDFRITYTRDQSRFISESFHAVQEHLIMGGLFAAGIVFLFIRSWRSTLIAAVAIPTSIIATYTLMNAMGFTLNQITMLALVLMVGIVIDDAIVVLENIFRFMEEKKMTPMEAALAGTRDIGLAVLATTLSLVIIFLPVAMMSGIVGKFMSSFGYTAAFAIMVSLLVSFTMTPMLSSRFLNRSEAEKDEHTKDKGVFHLLAAPYERMLRWSMAHRWAIVGLCVLVVLSSIPLFFMVGKNFIPQDDQGEFEVTVKMPPGSSLEGSGAVMARLEERLKTLPGIRNLTTTLGSDARRQVDRGSILVNLVPMEEREESQAQLMLMARERIKDFRDLTIGVQQPALIQGAGSTAELQFFLQGADLNRLDQYAQQVKAKLAQIPGVTDLDSSYESGKPELRVIVNRDKAADLNVSVAAVANAMRVLVGGDDQVTTYREGDDRYDVQLRVDKQFRDSPQALEQLYVPSSTLGNVPISNVAALVPATGPTQIERYNRQRQIFITANLVKGQALSTVVQQLEATVADLNMPPGYGYGLVGQSKEFGRAAQNFVIAFILSIVFMYMVLAAQFESFIDPITILISLPLSVPFALLSLLLMRENFSVIYTSVGILVLFGIVKKNSILQIDHIKSLRREGMSRLDAIYAGCMDRLRPIVMTTASLVAGMIPLALGGGAGSGSRRTVAIVVIGGQTLCLLLTLLVTPVAYSMFDDLAHATVWARLRAWFARAGLGMRRLVGQATGITRMIPLFLIAVAGVFAQEQTPAPARVDRAYPQVVPPPRVGVTITERRLTLQDAIAMALKNNLDVEIERTGRASAEQNVVAARGFFDPNFRWVPSFNVLNTPTGSVLQGAGGKLTDRSFGNSFFLRQNLTNHGTRLHADFTSNRLTTTNPFTSFSPLITTQLAIGLTQPLLRGRTIDPQRAEIKIRQKNVSISGVDVEIRTIDVIHRVEQSYWDLVAARQAVVVAEDSANWAREQLAVNQRMVRAGTVAPVELAAAEAELERRLDTLYASVALVTEAENQLKTLVAGSRTDEIWSDQIVPVDRDLLKAPSEDNVHEAVQIALKRRPELRSIALRQEVNDVQRDLAKDQTRPAVNFVGQYALNGLGGDTRIGGNPFSDLNAGLYQRLNELSVRAGLQPVGVPNFGTVPDFLVGNYGTALSNLFGGRYQSFQVGLELDLTFRNRTAESNLAQAAIGRKRLDLEQARVAQSIEAQVRNGLQGIETARQRIAAADASVRAAKEKLDSETRLYQTGESTNFLVLTRQNEYSDSRRRLLVAQLDFNKSVARLEQALGTTLEAHGVAVQ